MCIRAWQHSACIRTFTQYLITKAKQFACTSEKMESTIFRVGTISRNFRALKVCLPRTKSLPLPVDAQAGSFITLLQYYRDRRGNAALTVAVLVLCERRNDVLVARLYAGNRPAATARRFRSGFLESKDIPHRPRQIGSCVTRRHFVTLITERRDRPFVIVNEIANSNRRTLLFRCNVEPIR